ncbi:MAG: EamA family transporter [Opitutales bacterium]
MNWLLLTSLVWAFSFGLIKGQLAGLDATAVAALRLLCATVIFLPLLRWRHIPVRPAARLAVIGAVQFGLMYVLYLRAFAFLQAYEVVLCTIFTPIYVALLDAALTRRWQWRHLSAAVLALVGAGVILWRTVPGAHLAAGFLLMQASNLCFAAGQIAWRSERARLPELKESQLFALLYGGALAAALVASLFTTDWAGFRLSLPQAGVILYLGVVASGLGFFWWNLGALRVNAGTLAVMNNLKIPLGVAVSLLFFHEHADGPRLLASLGIMLAAVALAENWFRRTSAT